MTELSIHTDASPVDKLHAACQRAAQGEQDPYVQALNTQYRKVHDLHIAADGRRALLRDDNKIAELDPEFVLRRQQLQGATAVYDVAFRWANGQRDGEHLFKMLNQQASCVALLDVGWELVQESDCDDAEANQAFHQYDTALRTFTAGLRAALGLHGEDAANLAHELIALKVSA